MFCSMWDLLKRDGLAVQYIAVTALWNRVMGYNPLNLQKKSIIEYVSTVRRVSVCRSL